MNKATQLLLFICLNILIGQVDYQTQIQTIFNSNCTSCHINGGAYYGGLDLSTYDNVMSGGNSGAVITPFDHANSYLWQRVNNGEMPPGTNPDLSASQIDLIALWIDEGALENPAYTGTVWHVSTTGSDEDGAGSEESPFATIQHGIDVSSAGDTVLVHSGEYSESINLTQIVTLIGEEAIINGSGMTGVVVIDGSDITVSGFEIVGDSLTTSGVSIKPGSMNIMVSSNIIHGMKLNNIPNESPGSYGILVYGDSTPPNPPDSISIMDNEIYDVNLFGISLGQNTSNVTISGNNIHDLATYFNEFPGLPEEEISVAVQGRISNNVNVIGNTFDNVVIGVNLWLSYGSVSGNTYNNVRLFVAYDENNPVTLDTLPPHAKSSFEFNYGGFDLIIEGHFAFIQDGIEASLEGDTVLVAAGTYVENINYNGKNIVVMSSDGANNTIIDGNDNYNSVVTFTNGETNSAHLKGFTLINGTGNWIADFNAEEDGGGIFCYSSNPTLSYLIIYDNHAALYGGGVFLWDSSPIFSNVVISNNEAAGGISNDPNVGSGIYSGGNSNPVITNTIIWGNLPESDAIDGIATVSYSNIQGGWEGDGNIDENPLFCNPDSGDYTLAENSPCIGTGENGVNMGAFGVGCEPIILTVSNDAILPISFALHQNYPNPFNPVTTLRYDLPENGHVNITIYDMLGRQVKTLINQTQEAGYRSVIWNATNNYGKPVSAGIYLYQIQAGGYMQTKKMVLLK